MQRSCEPCYVFWQIDRQTNGQNKYKKVTHEICLFKVFTPPSHTPLIFTSRFLVIHGTSCGRQTDKRTKQTKVTHQISLFKAFHTHHHPLTPYTPLILTSRLHVNHDTSQGRQTDIQTKQTKVTRPICLFKAIHTPSLTPHPYTPLILTSRSLVNPGTSNRVDNYTLGPCSSLRFAKLRHGSIASRTRLNVSKENIQNSATRKIPLPPLYS